MQEQSHGKTDQDLRLRECKVSRGGNKEHTE